MGVEEGGDISGGAFDEASFVSEASSTMRLTRGVMQDRRTLCGDKDEQWYLLGG